MSRILVIDDEDVIRALVVEILETAGHEITGAESAESALALLEDNEFDLVVSDVIMPGLSGLELLEAVRSRRASLPVVLVTGAGTYDTLSQALTRGAAGLVTKPFSHAELQAAVADALERSARSRDDLKERLLAPTLASRARERDRGARLVPARPLRAPRCARSSPRGAARAAGRTRSRRSAGRDLHDVGKIGIPDRVLLKPAALDDDERRIVRDAPADRRQAARAARPAGRRASDRPEPSRALGRQRLPRSPGRRRDPARRADRRRRGLRRGDVVAAALPPAAHARGDRRRAARPSRRAMGRRDRRPRARIDRLGRARSSAPTV